MKKLTQIIGLCLGLSAITLTGCINGCSNTVTGTVVEQDHEPDSYSLAHVHVSYMIKDNEGEHFCATSIQENFFPFKVGERVKVKLSGTNSREDWPSKYVDGEFKILPCHCIRKYEVLKAGSEE